MSSHNPSGGVSTTRRRFLAASGTALLTAAAGCSAVVDFIGNQILEEVNVFNEVNRRVEGSIEVVDPAGDTALEETFDLAPADSEDNEEDSGATYADVWTETGSYEISVELANTEVDGISQATETMTIDDTDEEMVGIALGSDEEDEAIAFRVGESLSDFAEE